MRRVAVIASASGNGKTTFGRALAQRLDVRFVELDALVHGPQWTEMPDDELRALVAPIVRSDAWVIDGTYWRKIGHLVLDEADTVVWLDLPLRNAFWGRESLFVFAFRSHFVRRRRWPIELAAYPVVRLRTVEQVERWLDGVPRGSTP